MNVFDKFAEFLFQKAVRRERQRTALYARQTLAVWDRHCKGAAPEDAECMREAAETVLEWYDGKPEHLSAIALAVSEELNSRESRSVYIDISGMPQGGTK